ncbi:MAG: NAD(+) kinase [Gammaproteobacteria bacterium]|nr:NAD(+) kinase [Gammaproteobacteria bacterium]
MFKRIGIVTKGTDSAVLAAVDVVVAALAPHTDDFVIEGISAEVCHARGLHAVEATQVVHNRDLVIAVGGDGTMLRAAQLAFPHNVPVLGVNLGRLGFLADLSLQQVASGLAAILNGKYATEDRFLLRCEIRRDDRAIATGYALNDVVIQRWNTTRLITLHTYVDDCFVHSQRADGLIVSTPTGSTAYSLSGGGPILYPSLPAIVLVPVCPHTLTNRPIVLANTATIEIELATDHRDESRVTCDGNALPSVGAGDRIRITKHDQSVHLIHPADHDHFAILRAKLQWGQGPC